MWRWGWKEVANRGRPEMERSGISVLGREVDGTGEAEEDEC